MDNGCSFLEDFATKNQSTLLKYKCVLQNFSLKKPERLSFGCEFDEQLLRILLGSNKFDVMKFVANVTSFVTKKNRSTLVKYECVLKKYVLDQSKLVLVFDMNTCQ